MDLSFYQTLKVDGLDPRPVDKFTVRTILPMAMLHNVTEYSLKNKLQQIRRHLPKH